MSRQMTRFATFFTTLVLCFLTTSCARHNWYNPKQRTLPGGGPLAKVSADHTFSFVIIGDTRTGIETFQKQIDEINLLDPDMVIDVGDMVPGYAKKPAKIEAMWDEFDKIVSRFKVPLIMVHGNHDIWSPLSRKIYQRRYGKLYFSFDYKGVHFVALDSEVLDSNGKPTNRISDEQIKWLKNDLASHRNSRATFVFLHKPLWQDMHVAKGAGEHWFKDVHPILVKYGVSAVFAGHVHKYIKCPTSEGIAYYITGGGGAEMGNNPAQGDFHHYCLLKVRNNAWKMAVIKPGSVFPDTIVTEQENMMFSAGVSVVNIIAAGKPAAGELTITNSSSTKTITVKIRPDSKSNSHFKIIPSTHSISIKPGVKRKIHFSITLDDTKYIYPAPKLLLNVEGLSKKAFTINVILHVRTLKTPDCRKAEGTVNIDGKLDEPLWSKATLLSAFRTPQADHKAKFPTEARIAYDAANLYVSFRCHEPKLSELVTTVTKRDGAVWDDDSVEIFIDTNLDRKTYYQFVINANGVVYDGLGRDGAWNGKCTAKASREADAWTLEVAIPWKTIGMDAPKPGTQLGFEVARNREPKPGELTQWAPTFGGNHAPGRFGTIIIK